MNSGYHKEKNNYNIQYAIFNNLTSQSILLVIFTSKKHAILLKYRTKKAKKYIFMLKNKIIMTFIKLIFDFKP